MTNYKKLSKSNKKTWNLKTIKEKVKDEKYSKIVGHGRKDNIKRNWETW